MDHPPSVYQKTKTFPAAFRELVKVSNFVDRAAKIAGFPASIRYAIQMAVDEACSNIIEHSYEGEGQGDIICTCTVFNDRLAIELVDFGQPFDPSRVPTPDVNTALEQRKRGGLGLFFINKLMDHIEFQFIPSNDPDVSERTGKNTLTMVKLKDVQS